MNSIFECRDCGVIWTPFSRSVKIDPRNASSRTCSDCAKTPYRKPK